MIDITSANATVALSAESLFSVNLEQFGADSSFASEAQQMAETRIGVDGHMVAGYTPAIKTITITLEPSSPSLTFLQLLKQAQETNMKPYECQMVISVPSIGKRFSYSKGVLQSCKDLPDGNTVLAPTTWTFHFEGLSVEGL